jgi:hypothetical protein
MSLENKKHVPKTSPQKSTSTSNTQTYVTTTPDISPFSKIVALQRTIGNQAVQGLFASGRIQAKLKISQPNDKYERQADRVADQVMRMPEPEVRQKPT